MDLRQLGYFVAVAEEGTFTRAAGRCQVAQPSLSQQILNLEAELGQALFVRHARRAELTEAGRAAEERAKGLLAQAEELKDAFARRRELGEGMVTLGVIPTIGPYLLPGTMKAFTQDYPGISIQIREARTSELIGMLATGEIELAIASDVETKDRKRAGLTVHELFREALLLALPRGHRLTKGAGGVGLGEVPAEEMILLSEGHCLAEQVLTICGMNRGASQIECGQLESLLALVGAGLGIAFVPEMSVRVRPERNVAYRRLGPPEPERVISLVHKRTRALAPPAAKFLEYLSDIHG
jgi:LysR family transcriptional regulator, hydrogen peroxide-inducible genes activator